MRLWCSIPNQVDATSLYRAIGPLKSLEREGAVDLDVNGQADWPTLKGADAIFLQRPYMDMHLEQVRFARTMKKSVWVDYDDNLFAVPANNRRRMLYGNPATQHVIAQIIALADIVTVTTPYLAECLRKVMRQFPKDRGYILEDEKIQVIANAYDPELHPRPERPTREKLVVWRGSDSHSKDLWTHTPAILDLMARHKDWRFEFCGEPFWLTLEAMRDLVRETPQRISVTHSIEPVRFYDRLAKSCPAVVMVPLEDQPFNRSKSNIAWVEATAAGAVTVAPEWEEWKRPGIYNYSGPDDFAAAVSAAMTDTEQDRRWTWSRDSILTHHHLDSTNALRKSVLTFLKEQSK